jgi:hypothetical protein
MAANRELYEPMARAAAARHDVPGDMFARQIQQESGWDPQARSPSGALGLAQIIPRWHPTVDPLDPPAALDYAARWMADLHNRFGTWREALAGYNWGPANVAGGVVNGVQVPPWDGRRETTREETRRYLDAILGPGWPEPATTNEPGPTPVATRFEEYRDPQPSGTFSSTPKGVILHGSRSGIAGNAKQREYEATARYEVNNPAGLGWNATIGEGVVAVHLTPKEWGWHALANSKAYLGCELAQATEGEPITDAQVDAFCDWFRLHVLPVWPEIPLHLPSHAEADREIGVSQGKTDAFRLGDPRMDELRARIMGRLKQQPDGGAGVPDQPSYSVGTGILEAMAARGDRPASDEMFTKRGERDEWSEAYGVSGRRYIWLPAVARIFVYEPAA